MKHLLKSTIGLPLLAALGAALAQSDSPPVAIVDSGTLAGARFGPAPNEAMFLGIPYAAPPTGDLRWKPPQPVANWVGVREADTFAPACPQPANAVREAREDNREYSQTLPYYKEFRTDEDCLYLNVWTTNAAGKQRRPVMVWIHGGGGVAGTSQQPPFGPALARKGVVLVSIEFRIGTLGNLAHPALTLESAHHASGNYGALDQIAALQWIQRNIARFGGDPGNVTIFGHSNGGLQVCVLMASPLARRLFHRAVLESEVCSAGILPELKKSIQYEGSTEAGSAEDAGLRLARDLKITGPDVLAQLRAKTADEIIRASNNLDIYTNPTVDGWVVSEQPAVTFRSGREARISVLVGSTNDEWALSYNPRTDPSTVAAYKMWLQQFRFKDYAADLLRMYPANKDADVRAALAALGTDDTGQGAYHFARDVARNGQKAYLYRFSYPGKGKTAGLGAVHGSELKFISGVFRRSWWGEPNEEDERLAGTMSGYWTRFATTGDPNGPGLPDWPPYDSRTGLCLEIGHEIRSRPVPHNDRYRVFEKSLKARLAALETGK